MTLKNIAELAGVSVSTVSKAFSGSSEISEETKQRIFDLAKEHNCFDRYSKQRFEKKVIAVIVPEFQSDYYVTILKMLDEVITRQGGMMTVAASNFSAARVEELFAYYSFYCHADGIIIIENNADIKNSLFIPAVSIYPTVSCKNVDAVKMDMVGGMEEALRHLKENGHTKIGFAGEPLTGIELDAFKQAMAKVGLPVEKKYIKTSTSRFEKAGKEMMEQWLAEDDRPTAIMAAYDYIAIGAIKALRNRGFSVPEDFSIVGINDISIIPYLDVPLSTIRTYSDKACEIAVELLMKKLKNQYFMLREKVTVSSDFVIRKSTGPNKNA